MDLYSADRRNDDASVPDTVNNFDAETISYGADSVSYNFDAETVEFDAPVFDPSLHQDFEVQQQQQQQQQQQEEEELHQLSYRQGKWKYVAISFFGLLAACSLAVSLTLYFERTKDSSDVSPVLKVDAAAANVVGKPSLQPSLFKASTDECISGGRCSEEGSSCAIGTEICCGQTFNSLECECSSGQWLCMATDACNRPDCDDVITTAVPSSNPSSSSSSTDDVPTESPTTTIQTPSTLPSFIPTPLPTTQPSQFPTLNPSNPPYSEPSVQPSGPPIHPTHQPTADSSTLSPSNKPSRAPLPKPSMKPTLKPSLRPSSQPTTSPPSPLPSSSQPTSTPTARPSSHPSSKPSFSLSPSHQPTFRPSLQPTEERKYCVNIKFTTDNYPRDNGFTFLSKETGQVIYEQKTGSMKEPQTAYTNQFCDLSAGSYELVVTDKGGDGMTLRGNGSYVVDIDGQVILVGGRFVQMAEISHEIIVGFDANMSETDQGFLNAHNSRRKEFHESQNVSFRPMAWSAELAAGASAWAKEKAKTCSTGEKEPGAYGQNASIQRLNNPEEALNPEDIIASWMERFDPEQSSWGANLRPGGAVLWRGALYVGCASEVARIEDREDEYCQVTNCRYVRTTNCTVKRDDWVDSVLEGNGYMCETVFCPGADENGDIVEGACHA